VRPPDNPINITPEYLARLLAGLTLGLYILGLLAVNGYLLALGVSDFTLVRARFIYTGAFIASFWATSIIIPAAIFLLLRRRWHGFNRATDHRRVLPPYLALAALSLPGFLLTAAIFALLLDFVAPVSSVVATFGYAFIQLIIAFALGSCSIWVLNSLRQVARTETTWTGPLVDRIAALAFLGFLLIIASALSVLLFMKNIYPLVPTQFGGGRPSMVQFLFNHDAVAGAKALGIPFTSAGDLSAPVEMAYEGNQSYVVRLSEGAIVQLDKEMTNALITNPQ
jgi:hypothetical protein